MKQIYLKFSMLLVCMIAGLSSAWAEDLSETLAFSSQNNGITITTAGTSGTGSNVETSKGVVTVTSNLGYAAANKGINIYKGGTMTISVPDTYEITSIAFTYATSCYAFNEAVPSGIETVSSTKTTTATNTATYTPTTSASSFTFTNGASGKTQVNSLVITYKQTGESVPATSVSLDKSTASIVVNETTTLTPTVTPTNATNKSVTWTTSDKSVATVNNGVITGVGAGTATITATTNDGGYTATCIVTVTSIAVTGITLDKTELSLESLTNATLTATIAPANASNQKITWTSSDETIATVEDGVVYAQAAGTAVITATTADGNFTATCTVTVTEAVETNEEVIVFKGSGTSDDSGTKYDKDKELTTTFADGYKYVSAITSLSNVYPARNTNTGSEDGAKFGTSKATGSITITLANAVKASKIIVSACPYSSSEGYDGFKLNDITVPMTNGTAKVYADYEVALNGTEVSSITIASLTKRMYVHSITIVKGDNSPLATISVSDAGYATYYNSKSAYVMPEGMTGKTATVTDGALTLTTSYEAGETVPADEALVLAAAKGDYNLVLASTVDASKLNNDLLGTDEATELTADADSYFYALSLNAAKDANSVGFYWMNATGAAFTNGAHKAYLKVAKTASESVKGFAFNDATAINAVQTAAPAEEVIYDMTGRRVKEAKTGLYIVNGVKKYIK